MTLRSRFISTALLTVLLSGLPEAAQAESAAPSTTASPTESVSAGVAPTGGSFGVSGILGGLTAASTDDERRAAAKRLTDLSPDATPEIATALVELRKGAPPLLPTLKAAREHAPDRAKADAFDLLQALIVHRPSDAKAYDAALRAAALLRALAGFQTVEAARVVVENALQFGGALKLESARLVKSMGDSAVPALIEFKRGESRELRAWAAQELDVLGKKLPGDAVQTKDHALLAETLRAYGKTHDTDAIGVVLSFVNSDRAKVRDAARESALAFGQDAIWKLREQYTTLTGKTLPDGTTASEVARQLFAACDRFRLEEVYALVEEGKKHVAQKQWKDATAAFDKALARQPTLDGRGEMVAAYVEYGNTLVDSDTPESLALFRKALRIDPRGHRAKSVEAEIAYLEGKGLRASGLEDPEPFRRALALDPSHDRARSELAKLETVSETRSSLGFRVMLGAGFLVVAIGLIMLFGGSKSTTPSRRASR